MCAYVFRGHRVEYFTWVMVKQKRQEDSILAAVTEEWLGQLEALKWVCGPSPHVRPASSPLFEGLLCSPRPYLSARPLWVWDTPQRSPAPHTSEARSLPAESLRG